MEFRRLNKAEWYEDAVSLVSHGLGICLSKGKRSNLNYGEISEESAELSQRLMDHLNPHPEEVDQTTIDQLRNLAKIFRKLAAVTDTTQDQSTEESLNEIFEMGQREYSGHESVDMGEALDESTQYSSTMKSIFSRSDIDPRQFGSELGDKFE